MPGFDTATGDTRIPRARRSTGLAAHYQLLHAHFGRETALKIILLVLGLVLVYWILKSYRRGVGRRDSPPPPRLSEDMVRCERCGVHLPRSESVATQGRFYCTPEHQREHQTPR